MTKLTKIDISLIRLLTKKGIKQVDLSEKFDVAKSTISMIVNNKRRIERKKDMSDMLGWDSIYDPGNYDTDGDESPPEDTSDTDGSDDDLSAGDSSSDLEIASSGGVETLEDGN